MTVIQKDAKTAPQKIIRLETEERNEIFNKVQNLLISGKFDALIAAAPGNFMYASGIILPYSQQYETPKAAYILSSSSSVICPFEWKQLVADQNPAQNISAYTAADGVFTDALIKGIAKAAGNCKKVGLDSGLLPVSFVKKLKKELPSVEFVDITAGLAKLRMVKTCGEIKMLENAVRITDRAAVAALNHCEGCVHDSMSYNLWEFAERLRVHIGEFGGSGSGEINAVQGEDLRYFFKNPTGVITPGCPIRFEITGHHLGYWGDTTRTIFVGTPYCAFSKCYNDNIALKNAAVAMLKPGVKCSDVAGMINDCALEMNIEVCKEAGFGHGVGVTEREAPYLSEKDDTVLEPGMVIVAAIYTYGPKRELICSRDTYVITEDGARLLSWYKNYDKMYTLNGTTARHG